MNKFAGIEQEVIRLLIAPVFGEDEAKRIIRDSSPKSIRFTGVGYFLTLIHKDLPQERRVCHTPNLVGTSGELMVGFVAFLEKGELCLECFSYGDAGFKESDRGRKFVLRDA